MAELIIHVLEAVQIERDQAEGMAITFRTIQFLIEGRFEEPAILEAGQSVGDGAAFEIFEIVAFNQKWKVKEAGRGQNIDQSREKRDRLGGSPGKRNAALENFFPEFERALFGNLQVSEAAKKTTEKLAARKNIQ